LGRTGDGAHIKNPPRTSGGEKFVVGQDPQPLCCQRRLVTGRRSQKARWLAETKDGGLHNGGGRGCNRTARWGTAATSFHENRTKNGDLCNAEGPAEKKMGIAGGKRRNHENTHVVEVAFGTGATGGEVEPGHDRDKTPEKPTREETLMWGGGK